MFRYFRLQLIISFDFIMYSRSGVCSTEVSCEIRLLFSSPEKSRIGDKPHTKMYFLLLLKKYSILAFLCLVMRRVPRFDTHEEGKAKIQPSSLAWRQKVCCCFVRQPQQTTPREVIKFRSSASDYSVVVSLHSYKDAEELCFFLGSSHH